MSKAAKPIPDGYRTVTPWIIGRNTAGLIEKTNKDILQELSQRDDFKFLTPDDRITPTNAKRFSKETKSATFLKEALQSAIRCKICRGFLHFNSIQVDHIVRKQDGGLGVKENAQLAHPYRNSTVKG